jgi:hypothetical protein
VFSLLLIFLFRLSSILKFWRGVMVHLLGIPK